MEMDALEISLTTGGHVHLMNFYFRIVPDFVGMES